MFDAYDAPLFVDGSFREASDGRRFDVTDPATEAIVGTAADATPEDVSLAVQAARRAFDSTSWSRDHAFRRECLAQLQEGLRSSAHVFRDLQVAEAGICVRGLNTRVEGTIDDMDFDLNLISGFEWERDFPAYERGGVSSFRRVRYEPFGVVGALTPWNSPFSLNMWKSIPALATGNTVVLKTAPDTPLTGAALARIVRDETDIPPGVFNVVGASDAGLTGDALTGDPGVDMFHFTGSPEIGRRIAERAASGIRKVVLELGGKSANIVLEDADISAAIPMSARKCMSSSGQGCLLPTRMIVHESIYAEAVEILKETVSSMVVGDPRSDATDLGPIIRAGQVDRIEKLVRRAQDEGARLIAGGSRPDMGGKGFWFEPTVLVDVDEDSELAQTEVFGPVLAVIRYQGGDEEALRIANNTKYGLSGYVQSSNPERAMKIAEALRAGTVNVGNSSTMSVDTPFGGYGISGLGREHGVEGWMEFLQTKTIATPAS